MDLDAWRNETLNTINYHFDHDQPAMAIRACYLAVSELWLLHRRDRLNAARARWEKKVEAFNAMNDLKNDLRHL